MLDSVATVPGTPSFDRLHSRRQIGLLVIFIGAFVVFIRRPDALTYPQFWAEDGAVWYAQAYEQGFRSLLLPHTGYFQTFPRLIAIAILPVPFSLAPALLNIVAILIEALPVVLLIGPRFRSFPFKPRLLLAILYLALPNSADVHANITNSQWHLALAACLVLVGEPSEGTLCQILDGLLLVLCALTGPFCLFLAPIAYFIWLRNGRALALAFTIVLSAGAAIQGLCLLLTHSVDRPHYQLHGSLGLFIKVVGQQVFLALIKGMGHPFTSYPLKRMVVLTVSAIAGFAAVGFALVKGPWQLRAFVIFSLAVLVSALAWTGGWELLRVSTGGRYWFIPMLGVEATLVWLLASPYKWLRRSAALVLLSSAVGIVRDWNIPPLANLNFQAYAAQFSSAPHGAVITIPLNPRGFAMTLVKH